MALLWMDGFDAYSTAFITNKYPLPGGSTSGNFTIDASGRRGGKCLKGASIGGVSLFKIPVFKSSGTTCIVGSAIKRSSPANVSLFSFLDQDFTIHLRIDLKSDGSIQVYRGDGSSSLGVSAAGVFDWVAGFQYIETKVVIDNSVGVVTIKVNGSTVLNLTGQDTQNGGTANIQYVMVYGPNSSANYYDDLYILDGTGTVNNDFLGDVRIDAHFPNANGTTSDSTPSVGTDRFATVDDNPPNGDTDYNTITTIGNYDTLGLQNNVNSGQTPLGVQVSAMARKTDDGIGKAAIVTRVGGVDYDGDDYNLDTAYRYIFQTYDQDPSGADWTEATFNATEIGYKRTA